MIKTLLFSINEEDSPLTESEWFRAIRVGDENTVRRYVTNPDWDVNMIDSVYSKKPALIMCVETGLLDILKLLLSSPKIDVNILDTDGNTALMYACDKGFTSLIAELLESNKVDINLPNKFGQTAIDIAKRHGKNSPGYKYIQDYLAKRDMEAEGEV